MNTTDRTTAATVTLRHLHRGRVQVRAAYAGSDAVRAASTTRTVHVRG